MIVVRAELSFTCIAKSGANRQTTGFITGIVSCDTTARNAYRVCVKTFDTQVGTCIQGQRQKCPHNILPPPKETGSLHTLIFPWLILGWLPGGNRQGDSLHPN